MAEDTTVDEIGIENVSLLDTPLNAPADTSPSESDDTAADNGTDTQEGEPTQDKPADADDTQATEPDKVQESEQKPPEETKDEQRRRAQMEYQNRQRTRRQIEQQLDQTYGPKTQEELVDAGMDEQQAQIEALRQEMAYSQQRTYIAELNAGMQAEAVNVVQDFPVFDPKSSDFDPEFTQLVEQSYKTAARLQTDDSGIIVNAEVPLYDYYQQMANIYGRGTSKGAEQGKQQTIQMLSRTENAGGSSSVNGNSPDSLEALEDRLGNIRLA